MMVNARELGLVGRVIVAGGMIVGGVGCTESELMSLGIAGYEINAETPQQAQSAHALSTFAGRQGEKKHELNVAREGKSEVNVNVGSEGTNGADSYSDPLEQKLQKMYNHSNRRITLFTCVKMKDLNGDSLIDFKSEVIDMDKGTYNIDEETFQCYLFNPTEYRDVVFRSFTHPGLELIGETEIRFPEGKPFNGCSTGPRASTEAGDFMDAIKLAGPGKYRITATVKDSLKTMVYADVTIERNPKVEEKVGVEKSEDN